MAQRKTGSGFESVASSLLKKGDVVKVEANELIPADGEIILGAATVNEAAVTGESAPVLREAGGDRSAVTGGTTVLSDSVLVRVTAGPGEGFPGPHDRPGSRALQRQKTPNEIALTILLAALTLVFLLVVVTLKPFAAYNGATVTVTVLIALLVCLIPTTIGGLLPAIGIAGMDRLAQKKRHRHLPAACAVEAGPATWTCCCWTRPAPSRWATARR